MAKKKTRHYSGLLNQLTACISATMVLILVGVIIFFGMMATSAERYVKETFTVDVLLEDSLTKTDTQLLLGELQALPYVKKLNYISKEAATKTMDEELGLKPTGFLEQSPYYATIEMTLHADYMNIDSLNRYMPVVRQKTGVAEVIYPEDFMEEVNYNLKRISSIILIIIALLGIISVSLINNTIRLNVAQHRYSIQTMKLVGASWGFIRRPFLLRALALGVTASIVADLVLATGFFLLLQWDPTNGTIVTPTVMAVTLICVLIVGIALTQLCAYFSVNKHLSMNRGQSVMY